MITEKCYKYLSLVLCDAYRLGLTRTSVGATLSRHTSGSDQHKTVELPVSVDTKFYSRIWKTVCTLPFWSAMFFYITSGTDQNTYLSSCSELNTYMRVSSSSCQNTLPAHWINLYFFRPWSTLLPACSLLSALIKIHVHFSNSEYYYTPYPLLKIN